MKRNVKIIAVCALCAFMMVLVSACGGGHVGNAIPNVFGISYVDAVAVLESEGFEVKTIETNVKNISDKLLYPLESVDKGSVFKIDDYILDGIGNLTLNYEILRDEPMTSEDKTVVVYYAKEAYSKESVVETTKSVETSTVEKEEKTTAPTKNEEIGSDFKAAMDSYEQFFNEYVAILKKYSNNPSDLSLLADYTKYMGKYAQMMEQFEKWEGEDMTSAETAYYIEVQGRISKKLLEVAQ